MNTLWMMLLFTLLLRILSHTSFHPRLALLTGTVSRAADDMWHTAILVGLISICFAVIGTWRFGTYRADFVTLKQTMQTQFLMLFGGFQDNWAETIEMIVYTVTYMLVQFILILNFILAIIVEAYMQVRKNIEDNEVEMSFFVDVCWSYGAVVLGFYRGWPRGTRHLQRAMNGYSALSAVGYMELRHTGLFRSGAAISAFLDFYSKYDFMKVPEEAVVEKLSPEEERTIDEVESRIAMLLERAPSTVRGRLLRYGSQSTKSLKQRALAAQVSQSLPSSSRRYLDDDWLS